MSFTASGPALTLWLRAETRPTERRAPIVPADVATLVSSGACVVVERCDRRVFDDAEYAAAGASLAEAGSWVDAPLDAIVLGLKELPELPGELRHRHVFFGHAYKGQPGAQALLGRFAAGGGTLLDLEYLADDSGRRLAAFGYWAGYVGASLAMLQFGGRLGGDLQPGTRQQLDDQMLAAVADGPLPRVLVLGALGRSGTGARNALNQAGIHSTNWDFEETRMLDRPAMLEHDMVVNTVLTTTPVEPYLGKSLLAAEPHRLSVLCDVTCDVGSPCNLFPLYDDVTSWAEPVLALPTEGLSVIVIDNLPSLLPREASLSFSHDLAPQLAGLADLSGPWQGCLRLFTHHLAQSQGAQHA